MTVATAKPLWTLRFEAYEWCADPIISSPLWKEDLRLWLTSDGQYELCCGACGAQLTAGLASNKLEAAGLVCFRCKHERAQHYRHYKSPVEASKVQNLTVALSDWLRPISYRDPIPVAQDLALALSAVWTETLSSCYPHVESIAEEKQAWARLAEVAEAIEIQSARMHDE